jgi:hypothetical protein
MPPVESEPTIPASARPQTYALDRAATGIGCDNSNRDYLHSVLRCIFLDTTGIWEF